MFLWRPLEKPVGEQYEDVQTHAHRISYKAHSNFSRVSIPYKQAKCCIQLCLNTSTLRNVLQAHWLPQEGVSSVYTLKKTISHNTHPHFFQKFHHAHGHIIDALNRSREILGETATK